MIQADFHVHTTASDGRLSVEAVLTQATEVGLSHIAITDHDTIDGLLAINNTSQQYALSVIPGIEFSTDMPSCEIHILGYGVDIFHKGLNDQLALLKVDRVNRIRRMATKLNALGYPVEEDHIFHIARDAASVGRPHVAKALVEKGYFPTIAEVFHALLNRDKPGYVPHYKLSPIEVISLIVQAGGIPILAHPGLVGDDKMVKHMIDSGIAGLEVYHPRHDAAAIERYSLVCEEYGLLISGGSDFHAIPGRYPEALGIFQVPTLVAETFISKLHQS